MERLVVSLPQCKAWLHLGHDLSVLSPSTATHHTRPHEVGQASMGLVITKALKLWIIVI